MKIPHTICRNTIKAYSTPAERKDTKKAFLADDFEDWDKYLPKKLSVICVDVISEFWINCGHPVVLPLCSDSCYLLDVLPTTTPLNISVLKINEDIYWKRAHMARWPKSPPLCKSYNDVPSYRKNSNIFSSLSSIYSSSTYNDVSRRSSKIIFSGEQKFGVKTWKEYYLERHLAEALEVLAPEDYNPEEIKELSILCRNYITSLTIKQLKATKSSSEKDHIPLSAILSSLTRLREFSLCFKQTYVGHNFSWHIFKTTASDILHLAQGIKRCNLTLFRIQNSDIDCPKIITIMKALERNETLRVLDFSHCSISDHGVIAICKIVDEKRTIETLILANNDIGPKGAEVLGYVIRKPTCKLQSLDLRLNEIGNDGGQYLITACVRDATSLKSLCMAGCGLTKKTEHLGKMLAFNTSLEVLDISNNRLGENVGLDILKGMEYNKTLISIDMRMCGISQETEKSIRNYIHDNRRYIRLSFQEKGIVKLRKVVQFREFSEEEHNKLNLSTRDIAGEMERIFANFPK